MSVTSIGALSSFPLDPANLRQVQKESATPTTHPSSVTSAVPNRATAASVALATPRIPTSAITRPAPDAGSASALAGDVLSVNYADPTVGKAYTGTVQVSTGGTYQASVAGLPVAGSPLAAREFSLGTIINAIA